MAAPPPQTLDRLAEALVAAGAARAARAELTALLAAGGLTVHDVLESNSAAARQLKVVALLESLPGVGKVAARRSMAEIGIPDACRIEGLDALQRQALLARFGGLR